MNQLQIFMKTTRDCNNPRNERPIMEPLVRCRLQYEFEIEIHSDEEILQDAVDNEDVQMMEFMHGKGVDYDQDQLMLIAVLKMSPSVIFYLCSMMLIRPSKLVVKRSMERVQRFISDFEAGGILVGYGFNPRLVLEGVVEVLAHEDTIQDRRWLAIMHRLEEIASL